MQTMDNLHISSMIIIYHAHFIPKLRKYFIDFRIHLCYIDNSSSFHLLNLYNAGARLSPFTAAVPLCTCKQKTGV